jgi:SAM-dependent methyltransferase/uncharacterized protein YbaR (Trm112 family)
MRLSDVARAALRCPVCRAALDNVDGYLRCCNLACGAAFPLVDDIPILINDRSIFSVDDFLSGRITTLARAKPTGLKARLRAAVGDRNFDQLKRIFHAAMPTIDKNIDSIRNYVRLSDLLAGREEAPLVLVLGGGVLGEGIAVLMRDGNARFVESDVSFGPRTTIILDAHDIPFANGTFDAVVAQAVLEHVADPYRCVAEIHRVLKPGGLVYAETPFMQQVHAGRYDFTRFTHLGHRRLFRYFDEIDSGIICGPGMALSWAYQYFLTSLTTSPALRHVARTFAKFTSFFFKYFDPMLAKKAGSFDAASGFFILGRRVEQPLSDKELVKLYRGLDSL